MLLIIPLGNAAAWLWSLFIPCGYMKELSVESGLLAPEKDFETDFLYVQLVDKITELIRNDTLKPGDKLLSIRALSKEQGISVTTVYKAYSELEILGLIEAKTKSGYFVRTKPRRF